LIRKHSRLVEGLKGVDTEETEEGFDEVKNYNIDKPAIYGN
jgi:hypothetical protein